ncbi:MAG: hypothetical protein PHQ86_09335, partial [Dehalococcoidales bacterium]|nr:hypothetical protein [Dehalococcoidales bacterium]
MGIKLSDIKRAVAGGGNVSAFAEGWHRLFVNSPIRNISSFNVPIDLPEIVKLFKNGNKGLEALVAAWTEGREPHQLVGGKIDVTLVGFAPQGRNTGTYLANIIDEIQPDIIAIDTGPIELSANVLYAFSIACAVGLPINGEILTKDSRQFYSSENFIPGNINEIAIIKSGLMKIPLLPVGAQGKPKRSLVGSQPGSLSGNSIDQEMSNSSLLAAYRIFDESVSNVTTLGEGLEITNDICHNLMKSMDTKMREKVVDESCYVASRIMELATHPQTNNKKNHILALVDIKHYQDVEYTLGLLGKGILEEVYTLPKRYATSMIMTAYNSDELNEQYKKSVPEITLTQKLFQEAFDKLVKVKNSEILADSEVDRFISEIVNRTRFHADISRGASVRGTLACKEVAYGFAEIQGGLTRDNIRKAALITLPPRIGVKHGCDEITVINDIVKEVLYGISFSRTIEEALLTLNLDGLSVEDLIKSLKSLPEEQNQELSQKQMPAIITDQHKNQEILKYLEDNKLLKRGERDQFSFTQKGLEYLMRDLERKLEAGEISPADFEREKNRLSSMLGATSKPRLEMSAKELADTIMELMDAQDKQWSSELNFERMHVYYHIKANSEGKELDPQKRDYYGLKMLIDDLEKQGIIMKPEAGSGFVLTSEALDTLLEYLVTQPRRNNGFQGAVSMGKIQTDERKHEVRRFSTGDVFRDISVRHTLKEVVKQKKKLTDVRRSDFRVFMKQQRKIHSDIILCLDTSGSMGFQHKLMYTRLAAS